MAGKATATADGDNAASTEVMIRNGETALVTPEFAENYPALAPDEETFEILRDNLGDDVIGSANFIRVKVPSGDLNSFMIDYGEGDEAHKEITGILTAWRPRRSMWLDGEPDGSQPDCWSLDNKVPVDIGMYGKLGDRAADNPEGQCRSCPMNAFGSAVKGNGKGCKEQRLLFLTPPGALFPLILHVPPTSLRVVQQFMVGLINRQTRFYQVEVGVSLEKATSQRGQSYNKMKIRTIRKLEAGEAEAARVYGDELREMIENEMTRFDEAADTFNDESGISVDDIPAEAAATT